MNQIVKTTVQCVHHSVESQPSVCHASDQQICRRSVGQDSPRRCALSLRSSRTSGWKLECDTCSAVEPIIIQSNQSGSSPGGWGPYGWFNDF